MESRANHLVVGAGNVDVMTAFSNCNVGSADISSFLFILYGNVGVLVSFVEEGVDIRTKTC